MTDLARAFLAGSLLLASMSANAQQDVRVRGTIAAFDGKTVSVKSRDGAELQVEVPDNAPVSTTRPLALSDLKLGSVVGVTSVKRADGALVAIDVRPIPPTVRQGLSPYDLQPESTMTNATLEGVADATGGQELTLNYQSVKMKVLVPPGTPMSQATPGSRADIKTGETVFLTARPGEGGKLTAVRVQVSKDGVKPTQ